MSTCNFSHLIFDNNGKKNILEKREHFQEMLQGKSTCQRMKLDLYWAPCAEKETANGSGTYILNLTLLEENGCDADIGKAFLNTAPLAQELKPAIKIWLHKSQNLLHSQWVNQLCEEEAHRMGEKLRLLYIWQRTYMKNSKIKESKNKGFSSKYGPATLKESSQPIKKWLINISKNNEAT